MRGQVLSSLVAAAAALSTNNLRDARFSCSIVGDSLLAGLVAGGEGGFEATALLYLRESDYISGRHELRAADQLARMRLPLFLKVKGIEYPLEPEVRTESLRTNSTHFALWSMV